MRLSLIEHIVVNPEAVEQLARDASEAPNIPAFAKEWVFKRVRQHVMNDARLLSGLQRHEISSTDPKYAQDAMAAGQPVFMLQPNRDVVQQFMGRISHLGDFFQSLEHTVSNAPVAALDGQINRVAVEDHREAEKTIQKLPRMTIDQLEEFANRWMARAAKRVSSLSKEGGEVIATWPDGYYAIRFTDANAMKRDGADLQNCLARGLYWDRVEDGSQMVVAIRKPNDEAVVGMRFSVRGMLVQECKGKNNDPISVGYVGYVVDLLNKLKATAQKNSDLEAVGIMSNNGVWGSFKDIAHHLVSEDGVDIYVTDHKAEIVINNRYTIQLTITSLVNISETEKKYGVADIKFDKIPTNDLVRALNKFPVSFISRSTRSNLLVSDVYWNGKTFTSIEDGIHVGRFGDFRVISMLDTDKEFDPDGVLILRSATEPKDYEERYTGVFTVEEGMITTISGDAVYVMNSQADSAGQYIALIANKLGLKVTESIEEKFLLRSGWYVGADDVCKDIRDTHSAAYDVGSGCTLYKLSGVAGYMLTRRQQHEVAFFWINNKRCSVQPNDTPEAGIARALQKLVSLVPIRSLYASYEKVRAFDKHSAVSGPNYGLWYDPKKKLYVGDIDTFVKAQANNPDAAWASTLDPNGEGTAASQFESFLENAFKEGERNIPVATQEKLLRAFWPKDGRLYKLEPVTGESSILPIVNVRPANAVAHMVTYMHCSPKIEQTGQKLVDTIDVALSKLIDSEIGKTCYRISGTTTSMFPKTRRAVRDSVTASMQAAMAALKASDETPTDHFKALNTLKKMKKDV